MTNKDTSAIEVIIKAAIDGGWKKEKTPGMLIEIDEGRYAVIGFLLDPTFWQCAGKSLGWGSYCGGNVFIATWRKLSKDQAGVGAVQHWQYKWHKFIDALSEGDTIDTALSKII